MIKLDMRQIPLLQYLIVGVICNQIVKGLTLRVCYNFI